MFQRLLARSVTSDEIKDALDEEVKVLLGLCNPNAIYLFGSAARGDMTDCSDLDLLVVTANDEDLKELKKRYYCRKKNHSWPVDLIIMHEKDFLNKSLLGGVPMIVAKEGKLLFQRSPE